MLISSGYLGGAGGAERALFSILAALDADQVDVVIRHRLEGHLSTVGTHAKVSTIHDWRWRGAARHTGLGGLVMRRAINPLRRKLLPHYDVYLQFMSGMNLASTVQASVKLLVPSGNQVPEWVAQHFDHIALQAPDNDKFVPSGRSSVLLPPPVLPLSDEARPPSEDLPEDYLLTVFNPYGAIKGLDDLGLALASAPHPIVWCHSQQTLQFSIPSEFVDHPGIVHVDDPSPAEMRYLYENARAYLSFSKSEGFGWSIADALRYSRAIVSRKVGVLAFPEATQSRVITVSEPWSVDWTSIDVSAGPPDEDLDWLSPVRFRERLLEVVP